MGAMPVTSMYHLISPCPFQLIPGGVDGSGWVNENDDTEEYLLVIIFHYTEHTPDTGKPMEVTLDLI